jgi:CRP-like cAMP-binding protein
MKSCDVHSLHLSQPFRHQYRLKRGDILFREGEGIKGVHILKSGIAKLEKKSTRGKSFILRLAAKGSVMGHRAPDAGFVHTHTAKLVEDSRLCFIEGDAFRKLQSTNPSLRRNMEKILLDELRETEERLARISYWSLQEKVADTLLSIATSYGYRPESNGIRVHLDRQEMAEMSGTTKEQISKMLREFTERRLVHYRAKHFKYLDLAGLRMIASGQDPLRSDVNRNEGATTGPDNPLKPAFDNQAFA